MIAQSRSTWVQDVLFGIPTELLVISYGLPASYFSELAKPFSFCYFLLGVVVCIGYFWLDFAVMSVAEAVQPLRVPGGNNP